MGNKSNSIFAVFVWTIMWIPAVLFTGTKAQSNDFFAGLHASTLGAGLTVGTDISPFLAARASANYFSYEMDGSRADNEYSGDLDLRSVGILGDWHPFENGFRITGGAFLNGNQLSLSTGPGTVDIGKREYQGNLNAEVSLNRLAPYLGLGWRSGRGEAGGFSFFVDAGVMFQGSPKLSASGNAVSGENSCEFNLSDQGRATISSGCGLQELRTDLELEHSELKDDLSEFELYPVVMVGMTYRF